MAKIQIEKEVLDSLLKKIEQKDLEIKQLYDGSMKILELLGLSENNVVKSECFDGREDAMPQILKSAGSLFTLMTQTKIPGLGKKAEQKLAEKFNFIQPLIPIFVKYGNQFYNNGK